MSDHGVFEILPLPDGIKLIGGGWAFVRKALNGNEPPHFKACYFERGNSQLSSHNFHETFAPTATFTSLCIFLTIAAQSKMHVAIFGSVASYLNASIDKEIWIHPPEILKIPTGSGCKLWKALYGTHQARQCWWNHLHTSLKGRGFHMSNYDSSVYWNNNNGMIIWLHVENGVFAKDKADIDTLKHSLCAKFAIKWNASLKHIVGIDVTQDNSGFELNQKHLVCSIISKYWDK
ncbi:hypothetical protein O181_065498 [Austropuccinia psidii MF-1]|uniref:Reverse transcriptase Ty1/copia-type domain-containing protein n=1 Tax=Austropuccinia psidii MF-1 TaxID=1389203 RepID=A0A9Q3EPS0_9BASI|nr:hypothetical protein [Austropuccinia psidii MF-1]